MAETLVIHPGALGDVLLAIPALRALRSAFPDDALSLAAQPQIGELLMALGVVDRQVPFDSLGLDALFVDGPLPTRARALSRAARVISWFGARDATFVCRLSTVVPDALIAPPAPTGDIPTWEHLVQTVAKHTVDASWLAPVAVPKRLVEESRRWLDAAGWDGTTRLVMVHPGAGGVAKRWPVQGFARALEDLTQRACLGVIIHEGPADAEAAAALRARFQTPAMRLVQPPLPLLTGILSHVAVYLGNDSGISHLAATVGAPSAVLFTMATLAWRPWAPAGRLIVVTTTEVEETDVSRVLAQVRALLA